VLEVSRQLYVIIYHLTRTNEFCFGIFGKSSVSSRCMCLGAFRGGIILMPPQKKQKWLDSTPRWVAFLAYCLQSIPRCVAVRRAGGSPNSVWILENTIWTLWPIKRDGWGLNDQLLRGCTMFFHSQWPAAHRNGIDRLMVGLTTTSPPPMVATSGKWTPNTSSWRL